MIDDDFFGSAGSIAVRGAAPLSRAEPRLRRPGPVSRRSTTTRPTKPRAGRPSPPAPPRRPVERKKPTLSEPECQRRTRNRLGLFVAAVLIVVAAVGAKLVDIQVVSPTRYVSYGVGQRSGFRVLPAGRGMLADRNGQPFAQSIGEPQVVVDPTQVDRRDRSRTASRLAQVLGTDEAALARKLRARNRYQVLDTKVSPTEEAAVSRLKFPGVSVEERFVRRQPSGELAGSVVGRALPDGSVDEHGRQGLSGLEHQYDAKLHGTAGKLFYERGPGGQTIPGGRRKLMAAKPGTDLYLTLDQSLQYETERSLVEQVQATGAQGAMAVTMRPSTGEVLAMSSVDRRGESVAPSRDDQAVTSVFEPGSVNKVITVAGAVQEGRIGPDTVMQVPDHLKLFDRSFTDHTPHPTTQWSTTDILVTSSNIGTIKIAQELGAGKVDHYLRAFGFGRPSGLGFPGESGGIMRPVDRWSGVDIGAVPIGQGISVTALQMLSAYNVIANDGLYVAPKLVGATDSGSGRVPSAPSPRRRVVSPATATAVRGMLDRVVTEGTGQRAAVPGYVVAGKTGTARIPQGGAGADGYLDADGHYHYQSTFVGMVDGADLSIIVTVRDAITSIYGGDVAAPVFAHIAATALRRYRIPPPSLVSAARTVVPEVSASAKRLDGDAPAGGRPAAG